VDCEKLNNASVNFSLVSVFEELTLLDAATVNLDGRLDVTASGFSSLVYYGHPALGTIDTSGGSTVSKG
jgi:hypothetical protein